MHLKKLAGLAVLLALFVCGSACADTDSLGLGDEPPRLAYSTQPQNPVWAPIAVTVLNAAAGASYPKAWGEWLLLIAPVTLDENRVDPEWLRWATAAGVATVGLYDINANSVGSSRDTILRNNLIGGALVFGTLYMLDEHFGGTAKSDLKLSGLSLQPMPHRGVMLAYRWTFQ